MKKTFYTQPTIDIENVMVENGIAVSPGSYYGDEGVAGQSSVFVESDFDL